MFVTLITILFLDHFQIVCWKTVIKLCVYAGVQRRFSSKLTIGVRRTMSVIHKKQISIFGFIQCCRSLEHIFATQIHHYHQKGAFLECSCDCMYHLMNFRSGSIGLLLWGCQKHIQTFPMHSWVLISTYNNHTISYIVFMIKKHSIFMIFRLTPSTCPFHPHQKKLVIFGTIFDFQKKCDL